MITASEGTLYQNYIPFNKWEEVVKSKIFIDQMDDINSEYSIENMYFQIYNFADTNDQKIKKFNYINMHINDLLVLHYEDPANIIEFKNDIQLVFIFKTLAIKIFRLNVIQDRKLDKLFDLLLKNECPNLEYIYRAYAIPEFNIYVVVSKVVDVTNYKKILSSNLDHYRTNICTGLQYLFEHGWIHNDVSINNSGYDEKSNNYLLFDFNLSKFYNIKKELEEQIRGDIRDLEKSIKFNFEASICF